MKKILSIILLTYVVALHCSIAGMELLSWMAIVLSVVYRRKNNLSLTINREVLWPYLIFVFAVFVSLLVNPSLKPFLLQFGFMRFGIVMFGLNWALDSVWDDGFERQLIKTWVVCVLIVSIYAIFQCLTGIDLVRPGSGALVSPTGDYFKSPGFFSLSLTYAYVFGMSLCLIFLPAVKAQMGKWIYLVLALGVGGFLVSMSRGAWLAMILVIGGYLLLQKRSLILPFIGSVVAGATGLIMFTESFGHKITNMLQLHLDQSSAMRIDIWRGYWQLFLDHPFFGVGIFQGDKLLPETYTRLGITQDFVSHAHNNFLQILGGVGIVGFVAFVWLTGLFFKKAWSLKNVNIWGWSAFVALSFVFLGGFTEANFIDAEVNHMIMFTWAIVLVLGNRVKGGVVRS